MLRPLLLLILLLVGAEASSQGEYAKIERSLTFHHGIEFDIRNTVLSRDQINNLESNQNILIGVAPLLKEHEWSFIEIDTPKVPANEFFEYLHKILDYNYFRYHFAKVSIFGKYGVKVVSPAYAEGPLDYDFSDADVILLYNYPGRLDRLKDKEIAGDDD